MDVHGAYPDERRRLDETLDEIRTQLDGIGPRYYGDDYVEQVLDAAREDSRRRLMQLRGEPYFGRIDFREAGREQALPLYIGKRGMDRQKTGEPYVIDWRAPIASLFYSFTGGDASVEYEAPEGTVYGDIHRKRNISIREAELERVVDSYERGGDNLGLSDEFLLYRLGEKKDNRLRDIVSTIQAEQDAIIRAPKNRALIIQGAAGSGKTTVALHRLAYLLYQYQEQIRAERMIIFAPNAMFLDYISGVLPELGVGDVRQTTFADWALELLEDVKLAPDDGEGSRWFKLQDKKADSAEVTPGRFKGSVAYKEWLDEKLWAFENNYLPDMDFEPWDRCVLRASMIRNWFEVEYRHYPLAARRERLIGRINRWLEMQLAEIGDPKKRKERSKTGKARLRTYAGKLPAASAGQFHKRLFGGKEELTDPFIPEAIRKATRRDAMKGVVRQEDLVPLVWIHRAFHGTSGQMFDHVVVDEAQDISPFQIALLRAYMNEPSFTVLGDLAQGIHAYRGIHRWEELSALFDEGQTSYHELKLSYRSTLEIIEFANGILAHTDTGLPPAQPVFRSGEPVEVVGLDGGDDAEIGWLCDYIRRCSEGGMRTIAVIGRTEQRCRDLHERLQRAGMEASLIAEGQRAYQGGVSVVPVYLAKGLEFDAVVLPDADSRHYTLAPQDAKLLYVGCTRALHRLALLYSGGEATPLIAGHQ